MTEEPIEYEQARKRTLLGNVDEDDLDEGDGSYDVRRGSELDLAAAGNPTEHEHLDEEIVWGGDDGGAEEWEEERALEREAEREARAQIPRNVGRPEITPEQAARMVEHVTRALEARLGRPLSEILAAGVLRRGRRRAADQALADDLAVRVAQAHAAGAKLRDLGRALGVATSRPVAQLARRGEEILKSGCSAHGRFRPDCLRCIDVRLGLGSFDETDRTIIGPGMTQHLDRPRTAADERKLREANLRADRPEPADVLSRPRPWRRT